MKPFYLIFSFFIFFTVVSGSYKGVALAANQSEGAIPQTGDLCGGTGGNGQIISVGNNTFTLRRNDDGSNQIIHLASHATIKTSTGPIFLSKLKPGERVTLVGGPNRDGSFTADTVVLCSGTQGNGTNHTSPIIARNYDTNYKKVSGAIDGATILLVGLIWAVSAAFLTLKKKKSFVYLLFFTIFYIYLYKVLDYTLLQFQSLLLLQHFLPNLVLNGVPAGRTVNLIPLATLRLADVKTSLLNILMMLPFGFGLPFITDLRLKKVVIAGLLVSIAIEFLQLVTGFMANTTFRIADINDVIFNTLGVAIGYMLFVGFVRIYRNVTKNWKISANPLLRYIAERPQVEKQ